MPRAPAIIVLALATGACAAEPSPRQVVRLDLDEIAALTAARDRAPGFESLGPRGALSTASTVPTRSAAASR